MDDGGFQFSHQYDSVLLCAYSTSDPRFDPGFGPGFTLTHFMFTSNPGSIWISDCFHGANATLFRF